MPSKTLSRTQQAIVLYDADCGFCKRMLAKLLAWDRRRRLRPVPLQGAEAEGLLPGMSEEQRMASWHLVAPDGGVRSGGAAVAPLLRMLPGGAAPAWLADRMPAAADRAYRWVAAHRTTLGRRLAGERARRRAERRIAERS